MMISKYLAVFRISWEQALVYRLNFVLWRVRTVLQLLLVYFIWWTVFKNQDQLFGYSQQDILTYILVSAFIRAIVLSSRASGIADQINDGSIANFLLKPLGFIRYFFSQDFSDKLLNIFFVVIEITAAILILKPAIILQTNVGILLAFIMATILGLLMYFCIAFMIGISAFWVENSWGPLFLMTIFLEGFGGGLFPIDILPKGLFNFLMLTPFPYLIYFPSKIYLGTLPATELVTGFIVVCFWLATLVFFLQLLLKAGLRHFSAVGS